MPLPVGMTASVSRPASTDSMISACPGRSSRSRNTSRIFSSARCRARARAARSGADTMRRRAGRHRRRRREIGRGIGRRPASADRRITIVGTPSSAALYAARLGFGRAGIVQFEPRRPQAARDSSSELRLNSCKIGHVHVAAARPPTIPRHSLATCPVHLLQSCHRRRVVAKNRTPTDPSSAGAAQKTREPRASIATASTRSARRSTVPSFRFGARKRCWHSGCRRRGGWRP